MAGTEQQPKVRLESDVWIPACKGNEQQVFELAKVVSMDDEAKTCVVKAFSGPEVKLDLDKVQLTNPRVVPDMTSLYHINDAGILHNLKIRSEKDLPYTMMGSVLVSVNPLHSVPDPELPPGKAMTDVPHPFSIAENAFKNMTFSFECRQQRERQLEILQRGGHDVSSASEIELVVNQSVVISGESGSGKTEAGKRVLRHLVTRTTRPDQDDSKLDTQLAGVGPILEGFGNASTVCNHNSSRFGKFSKLHFVQGTQERSRAKHWDLVGATVETYLLEKSRVVNHSNGERNFHVFYQLINGADDKLRAELKLPKSVHDAREFRYLTPGLVQQNASKTDENAAGAGNRRGPGGARMRRRGSSTVGAKAGGGALGGPPTVSNEKYLAKQILEGDKRNFSELQQALSDIGKTSEDFAQIMRVVAGIMHLGNVSFEHDEGQQSDAAKIADSAQASLELTSQFLGIPTSELKDLLLLRQVKAGMEVITTQLDVTSAQYGRDALAKWTYGIMFEWLVQEVNTVLMSSYSDATPLEELPFIGVLDIFGFESFQINGFEQLLINYTNESLQSTFNYQVFVAEADLYKREGLILDGDPFVCPADDGACLDLFEGKPGQMGLLMEIDSESRAPKPTDEKMNRRLHSVFSKEKSFPKPHPKDITKKFLINHYAGTVEYTVGDFVEKNNDRIPAKMNELMKASANKVVAQAFEVESVKNGSGKGFRATKTKKTVVANFGGQIRSLVETLESTKCSFIRCVKPNPEMRYAPGTNWFNNGYVNEQLKCLSIPQTAAVLKSGFPTRIEYDTIVNAYESALPADALAVWQRANENGNKQNGRTFVSALFWAFKVPNEAFRLGLSKVFFSSGMIDLLDRIMHEATSWATADGEDCEEKKEVGRRFKLYYARLRWRRCYAKVVACNKFLRFLQDSRVRGAAARTMQRAARSFLFRNRIYKLVAKRHAAKLEAQRREQEEKERKAREEKARIAKENFAKGNVSRAEAAAKFAAATPERKRPSAADAGSAKKKLPPLGLDPSQSGMSARQAYRSAKRLSGGWNLSGALRTPKGSLNPDFLDLVEGAQKGLKEDNTKLKEQNEKLQSDLDELKQDIALLKRSMPLTHVLHIF